MSKGVLDNLQHTAQEWTDDLKGQVAKQVAQRATAHEVKMEKTVAEQARMIRELRTQVNVLMRTRRGGGFPLFPLLLVGGAVYFYRSNASFKQQVDGLLDRVNPGIRGNLTRAGDAAKDAVQAVVHGDDPRPAASDAVGELKRAGQKGVEQAKDMGEAVQRGREGGGSA